MIKSINGLKYQISNKKEVITKGYLYFIPKMFNLIDNDDIYECVEILSNDDRKMKGLNYNGIKYLTKTNLVTKFLLND